LAVFFKATAGAQVIDFRRMFMSRTPLPDHLVHDPVAVERDGKRLERLCAIALGVVRPHARKALRNETARSAARLLSANAVALLNETLREQKVEPAQIAQFEERIATALKTRGVAPSEQEVEAHAVSLADALVKSWLQVLLDKREAGRKLETSELVPAGPDDTSRGWSAFWDALAPYGVPPADIFGALLRFCDSVADERTTKGGRISLPQQLELSAQDLQEAIHADAL
jgi:hypothetical protein